jgi:hypothetical protein
MTPAVATCKPWKRWKRPSPARDLHPNRPQQNEKSDTRVVSVPGVGHGDLSHLLTGVFTTMNRTGRSYIPDTERRPARCVPDSRVALTVYVRHGHRLSWRHQEIRRRSPKALALALRQLASQIESSVLPPSPEIPS